MAQLKISLLGAVRVERDGIPIEVDTRKAIALLAYLAMTGVPHRREALAAFFWPEADDDRARGALRRTLSTLRAALVDDWLVPSRDDVELGRDSSVWLDVAEFRAQLAACRDRARLPGGNPDGWLEQAAQAIELYRDDFMAGFSLRDSPAFDDWQAFHAEALRRELSEWLTFFVGSLLESGDFDAAIRYNRRLLMLDTLNEEAHRRQMLLYAWVGEQGAALRQYRACVRILENDLGVAPLAETTALYQRIQRHDPPPPPRADRNARTPLRQSHGTPDVTSDQGASVLVGRTREMDRLATEYDQVGQDGRLIVIEGEAGVGKTYLAEAFLRQMRDQGVQTLVMRGYEGETQLAYGPFVEGLRGLVEAEGFAAIAESLPRQVLAEISRLVPQVGSVIDGALDASPLDGPGAQARFFDAVMQVILAMIGGARPGILFVDDLQWIDQASLDLLGYLVRRLRGRPLLVLLGWCRDDLPAAERIAQLLAESERLGSGTHLSLGRLSRAEVRVLTGVVLLDRAWERDDGLSERLYRETEGLPFFLAEYLAFLRAENPPDAISAEWPLPRGIRDLVRVRLSALTETERQLLTTAAIIGRAFDFGILRDASGRSEDETVSGLESLLARGLIVDVATRAVDEGFAADYDFSHEKVRKIVSEETSLARRRLLHARIADALRSRDRRDPRRLAALLANHLLQAGREAEAAEQFVLAGDLARSLYANAEALAHYQSALALGHPNRSTLNEALGDLHTLSACYDEAFAAYETAAALRSVPSAGLEQKLGNVDLRLGRWQLAGRHFATAEKLLKSTGADVDARAIASLLSDWSLAVHRSGDIERGWALGQRALAFAEQAADDRELARAHNQLGILARARHNRAPARHHFEASLVLGARLQNPEIRAAALNNLALVSFEEGDVEQALQHASEALDICAAQGDRHREAALHSNLADFLHNIGRRAESIEHIKRSVEILAEINVVSGEMQPGVWQLVEW